jgi:hypothetical protein
MPLVSMELTIAIAVAACTLTAVDSATAKSNA